MCVFTGRFLFMLLVEVVMRCQKYWVQNTSFFTV